jgi:hypothetical protein
MSKVVRFTRQAELPSSAEDRRFDQTIALARTLIESLPPDQREPFLLELIRKVRASATGPRAGEVLNTIVQMLPERKQWRAAEVKQIIDERGLVASSKEVYNALHYLARRGSLRRISYGVYEFNGMLLTTSDDFGGERGRLEDLSDDDRQDYAPTEEGSRR